MSISSSAATVPTANGPQHAPPPPYLPHNSQSAITNNTNNNNNNNNSNYEQHQQQLPLEFPARHWSMMTRTIAHYERLEQIGEGTYGQVYKARCKDTNQIVAMKKIRVHHGRDWGMPPTVIREIKILKRLQHPNLVRMMEVVSSKGVEHLDEEDESTDVRFQKKSKDRVVDAREGYKGNLFLVLEYVSHDLTGLMDIAYKFTPVQVKCIFRQLLEALDYMHQNKYVHRDIKSSNILLDHHYRVKLADFGLARCIEPPILDNLHDRQSSQEFTNKVITLWYRPPEILLGATRYGPPVDVWSAGCILAELLLGKPLFTGKTEMDQLQLIFDLLGTPSPDTWEGLKDLKLLRTGQVTIPSDGNRKEAKIRHKYGKKIPSATMNLLEKLLELDPAKRLAADRALDSRYFKSEPVAPKDPADLGPIQVNDHFHEFQTKKKRRQAKAEAEKSKEAAIASGMDEEQAQEKFDATYRKLMNKVASEGFDAFGTSRETSSSGANRKDSSKDKLKDRKERSSKDSDARDDKRDREAKKKERTEGGSRRKESEDGSRRSDRDKEREGDSKRRRRREADDKDPEEGPRGSREPRPVDSEEIPAVALEPVDSSSSRRSRDRSDRRDKEHRDRHRKSSRDRRRDEDRELSRRGGDERKRDRDHERNDRGDFDRHTDDPDDRASRKERKRSRRSHSHEHRPEEEPRKERKRSRHSRSRSRDNDRDRHGSPRDRHDSRGDSRSRRDKHRERDGERGHYVDDRRGDFRRGGPPPPMDYPPPRDFPRGDRPPPPRDFDRRGGGPGDFDRGPPPMGPRDFPPPRGGDRPPPMGPPPDHPHHYGPAGGGPPPPHFRRDMPPPHIGPPHPGGDRDRRSPGRRRQRDKDRGKNRSRDNKDRR